MGRVWSERWKRIRVELALGDLLIDVGGKALAALGLGALLAHWLRPCAWGLIVVGLLMSVTVKMKYWKRFWTT